MHIKKPVLENKYEASATPSDRKELKTFSREKSPPFRREEQDYLLM
jgi:hypothetical protein